MHLHAKSFIVLLVGALALSVTSCEDDQAPFDVAPDGKLKKMPRPEEKKVLSQGDAGGEAPKTATRKKTPPPPQQHSTGPLRIATFNIENFNDAAARIGGRQNDGARTDEQLGLLAQAIETTEADVMAVQEIVPTSINDFTSLIHTRVFNGRYTVLFGDGDAKLKVPQVIGIVYDPNKLTPIGTPKYLRFPKAQALHKHLAAAFETTDKRLKFAILGVHLKAGIKPEDQQTRLRQLAEIATDFIPRMKSDFHTQNIVVLGDMNTAEYNQGIDGKLLYEQQFAQMKLTDLSSGLTCTAYSGVYGKYVPSFLDHILVNDSMRNRFQHVQAIAGGNCEAFNCEDVEFSRENQQALNRFRTTWVAVSDHCPVTATMQP